MEESWEWKFKDDYTVTLPYMREKKNIAYFYEGLSFFQSLIPTKYILFFIFLLVFVFLLHVQYCKRTFNAICLFSASFIIDVYNEITKEDM